MKSRKAQSSVELMVILALALVALISIISLSQQNLGSSQAALRESQARQTVQSLAKAADEVYAEGPGAKKRVYVTIPEGVDSISISGNIINIKLRTETGTGDINAKTAATVSGTLSATARSEWLWVTANENGQVTIGATGITVSPATIYSSLYPGNSTFQNITVTNLADSAVTITVSVTAPTSTNANITLLNSTNLNFLGPSATFTLSESGGADYTRQFTLNVSSNANALGSYYDGYATANSSSESVRVDVSIEVSALPSAGGGASNNVSSIVVSTYKEPARTTPKQIFQNTLNITLIGTGWNASNSTMLNVTFPNGTLLSGYPETFTANSTGGFVRYLNATNLPALTGYVVWTNQSTASSSGTFDIGCG